MRADKRETDGTGGLFTLIYGLMCFDHDLELDVKNQIAKYPKVLRSGTRDLSNIQLAN